MSTYTWGVFQPRFKVAKKQEISDLRHVMAAPPPQKEEF